MPDLLEARRALQSATLRDPQDDGWLYDGDLGSRMANVMFTTRQGMGYDTLTCKLLGQGGGSLIPFGEALSIWRGWDFGLLRYSLMSKTAWVGKLWGTKLGSWVMDERQGLCTTIDLQFFGLLKDMTNKVAHGNAKYADEFATVSATELAIEFMHQDEELLFRKPWTDYGGPMLRETGINIATGGLSVGFIDYPYDMLLTAMRAGSAEAIEYWIGAFAPEDGLWIQPKDGLSPRWRLPLKYFQGQLFKDLQEYANRIIGLYTDGETSNLATEWTSEVEQQIAADLHNGVTRERPITLDRVGEDGANAGRDTYLTNHRDPIGWSGSFVFDAVQQGYTLYPMVPNADDGLEPGWQVHCGEVANIPEALPFDPELRDIARDWPIENTGYDVDNAVLTITLDQRSLRSRPNERPAEIANALREQEPAASRKLQMQRDSFLDIAVPRNTDVELSADTGDPLLLMELTPVRRTRIKITMQITIKNTFDNTNDDDVYWGYSLDDDGWDSGDDERSAHYSYTVAEQQQIRVLVAHFKIYLTPEPHTLHWWARADSGDANYLVDVTSVKIIG